MKYSQEKLFKELSLDNDKEYALRKWTKLIKERDMNSCQFALPNDDRVHDGVTEAHHKFPKKYGGRNILRNGISLCKKCHAQFLIEAEQRYYFGVLNEYRITLLDLIRKISGHSPLLQYYKILYYLTGSKEFRGIQLDAIRKVIEGKKNIIVVSPTGSGKSLIYYMSGILFQGQSLVISPLIALQKEQVQKLWSKWIPATYINSELDQLEKGKRISNALRGKYSFIFIHPKQLLRKNKNTNEVELRINNPLLEAPIKMLCVDEAHVVEKYGVNFIEEYDYLGKIRNQFNSPPTILLSASLTKKMQENLKRDLFASGEETEVIVTGYYRPEIELEVVKFPLEVSGKKLTKLEYIRTLIDSTDEKIIIFATTTKEVDDTSEYLKDCGYNAEGFHSKKSEYDKQFIQKVFSGDTGPDKEIQILVCTSAFGMGIDIKGIHLAIHYSLPFSLNDYYQQIGRIGRDGRQSKAYLLVDTMNPTAVIDFIQEKELDAVDDEKKREFLVNYYEQEKKDLMGYIEAEEKWQHILDYFGEVHQKKRYDSVIIFLVIALIVYIYFLLIK